MKTLLLIVLVFFMNAGSKSLFAQCEDIQKVHANPFSDLSVLTTGTPILFPEIKLKITKRDTGEIMPFQRVVLRYEWEHFIVPYRRNNLNGGWSIAYDVIGCMTDAEGVVRFPEYNFVPRGWYDGPKLHLNILGIKFSRLPKFKKISVGVSSNNLWVTPRQAKKIIDNKIDKPMELARYSRSYIGPIKMEIIP